MGAVSFPVPDRPADPAAHPADPATSPADPATPIAPATPSPLLERRGAVAAPPTGAHAVDVGTPWHYGDPLGEQRAAERSAVLLDGWSTGSVTVTGDDRLTWLHSLCTQHLEQLGDARATEALWLSPRGHVQHWTDVAHLNNTVHLRTEPGAAPALLAFLQSMTFWSKVDLAETTDATASVTVLGPAAADTVSAALAASSPATDSAASSPAAEIAAGTVVALTSGPAAGGWLRGHPDRIDVIVPRGQFAAATTELIRAGAVPAGSWAGTALRIRARRPRFGVDNDDRTIPNEMPWLTTAVHLNKGCYQGQETVARVDNLGQPPRRLVLLHLDGSADALPVPGDAVTLDGRTVGRVGSVAQHWEDGPIALALVKRTVGPGPALMAGGADAAVDADDTVTTARPVSVDRRAFHDFRRR